MSNGSKRKSSLDFDVGLGLKMPTESRPRDGNNAPIFGGSDIYSRSFLNTGYGGGMTGKALFTASQWEELERQNLIHKYIMASIPVPSQLLFPLSTTQSNTSSLLGMDLKYSASSTTNSGSDAEPWRCKRTDGKKWRCSRDVAPDHKYCERHAHKNKPRSRKLVESQPHTSSTIPTIPTTNPPFDQTRCMEWLMRNGTTSNNQQQWHPQFLQTSSSRFIDNRENSDTNKNNVSVFNEDKLQALIGGYNTEPYIPDTSHLHKYETLSTLGSKVANSLQNPEENQTTRRFIDAWDNENKKFYPSSSLTLSMNGIDDHHHNDDNSSGNSYLGSIGMRGNDGIMKFGGPLGEALCLGNAMSTRGSSGNSSLLASPGDHGYSNTNSSSCSKGSCEDGNNAFNFIG